MAYNHNVIQMSRASSSVEQACAVRCGPCATTLQWSQRHLCRCAITAVVFVSSVAPTVARARSQVVSLRKVDTGREIGSSSGGASCTLDKGPTMPCKVIFTFLVLLKNKLVHVTYVSVAPHQNSRNLCSCQIYSTIPLSLA